MKFSSVFLAASLLGACVADSSTGEIGQESDVRDLNGQPEAPMLGQHLPRGYARPGGTKTASDMTWHNGAVMPLTTVTPIFWGTHWADTTFAGDEITGMDRWYSTVGGTAYMITNTEYTGTNGQVGDTVSAVPHLLDTSSSLTRAPKTSDITTEACNAILGAGLTPSPGGYYPVYSDLPRGHAGYCAWHSYGTCNGVEIKTGFFFRLDGDKGCDPQDTSAGPPPAAHSQGLAALANVSGHELSEMVTDPDNGGWWDSSGNENGDKCAWTFSNGSGAGPGVVSFGGELWKIQGNFSNTHNDKKTGYDGGGCIDGNQP